MHGVSVAALLGGADTVTAGSATGPDERGEDLLESLAWPNNNPTTRITGTVTAVAMTAARRLSDLIASVRSVRGGRRGRSGCG